MRTIQLRSGQLRAGLLQAGVMAALVLALPGQATAEAVQNLTVAVNEARAVPLSGAAAGVAVGNPLIAAVTVQNDRLVFVTGKGIGATNLVIVDGAGRTILERTVMVTPNQASSVALTRGAQTVLHDCTPICAAVEPER